MKNVTFLKLASLFIFLLSAQSSFAQLNCSDYPDWVSGDINEYSIGDRVHYQGSIWQSRYGNNSTAPSGTTNNSCDQQGSQWCFVDDCSSAPPTPTAAFSASANAVDTTQTITFTNNSTNATSYSWNFGDSTTSSATSPSHQYASAGSYTVTLTATGSSGSDTATTSITVNIPSETLAIQDFDGATPSWSYTDAIQGTSTVDLFFEDLTGESNGDTTGSASGINWALSGGGGSTSELYVHGGSGDHVHMSENDGTIAVWETTDNIDITSTANLNFTVKVRKTANLDSDDYVRLLYSKNGGALIEIATYYDDMPNDTIIGGDINSLTGNTLIGNPGDTIKLFMHVRNDSSSEQFEWEEIKLTGNVIDGTINSLGTNTTNAWGNKGYLDEAEITFNTVDLSNHDNLTFSFDYFIDSETETSGQYEDNFVYDIFYNGSETASLTEELIVNGGATDAWTSKSVSVPDGTTSMKVIFNYDVTGASTEYLGIDNVKVTGIIKLPGCATNLSPTNTATNVSVTPTLSWDAVSGATGYKVFYGTDSNTSTAVAETASTSVILPTLQNGTQYYWKVVPTNARGDATGCGNAISFTTIVAAPGCASYTSPTDGAIDISLTPELSWSAVSGATGYKVYYSSDSSNLGNPTLVEVTSYQLPQLGSETQYFWKVVPTNAGGEATGCSVISFTTLKNPAGSVFITGNTVTISKNAYLYLEKDFTNTGGSLTLNSSSTEFASIIVEGTASGNITYNRFVNYQAAGEWDMIGPPVLNQNMQSFAQTNTNNNTTSGAMAMGGDYYALGQYLTQWGSWVNYTTSTIPNANFPAAKGYQMGTNSIGSGNDMQGQTLAFTGEIATTTQTINIQNQNGANGGNGRRWNLVANPFSSYINGNTNAGATNGGTNFIDVNADVLDEVYTGLYYWDADEDGWDVFNQLQTNSNDGTLFIAPGQGFFVAARNSEVAQISFTPQMRTILGGDDFISGAPILLNYKLDLKLFNGSAERAKTKFHFQQGLTLGLDAGYDAGAYNQAAALSSRLPEDDQGVNFQLNAMNLESAYNQSIPLVINQQEGQNFRVSISNNTLPEDVNVYLEDTQNGTLTSLKDQDFELIAQSDLSDAGRFYIRFTTQNLAVNDVLSPSSLTVFKLNTDAFVTIQGLTPEMGKTTATIYNMLGMKVREKALNNTAATQQISTQGLASGVYIINLKAGEQAISKKIIIQ
jgi:PKD repeat protein